MCYRALMLCMLLAACGGPVLAEKFIRCNESR